MYKHIYIDLSHQLDYFHQTIIIEWNNRFPHLINSSLIIHYNAWTLYKYYILQEKFHLLSSTTVCIHLLPPDVVAWLLYFGTVGGHNIAAQ